MQFRNRTGRIAPARISRPLLLRVLAYRIQAEVFGDLRPETRRMLDRVAAGTKDAESRGRGVESAGPTAASPTFDRPRIGTVLVREWRGRMQHVMVLADGFAWNGTTFASLSAVAHAITGTKWNGRRFFGLDRPADEQPPLGSDPKSDRPSGRMICRSSALARPVASSSRGVGPLGSRAAP